MILQAYWFKKELLSPLRKRCGPLLEQTSIPFTKGWFVPSLAENGKVVLEKKKGKSCQWILPISIMSAWKMSVGLHLYKHEYPLHKNALWQVWLKLAECFWSMSTMYFFLFSYILPKY